MYVTLEGGLDDLAYIKDLKILVLLQILVRKPSKCRYFFLDICLLILIFFCKHKKGEKWKNIRKK